MTSSTQLQCIQQSRVWSELLPSTPTRFTSVSYDLSLHDWSFVRVLIAGAGGIGCELLHQVAMCGFANITIIDMDKVELSNLNRQFLFRETDIGQYKSVVAAKYIHDRFTGIHVEAVVGRIESQSDNFYKSFHAILLALDTVEARIWINNKIASLATRSIITQRTNKTKTIFINNTKSAEHIDNTNVNTTLLPCIGGFVNDTTNIEEVHSQNMCVITHATFMIDTGTEGYQGHCRIIDMSYNHTPCIECERELFVPEQNNVALCTLHHYPRRREDCVLYAAHVLFPKEYQPHSKTKSTFTCEERENNGHVEFDVNNVEHINWVSEHARARQELFQVELLSPIDVMYTRGVFEHIVPAVNFTNSFVAGEAVLELMKWLWGVGTLLNNFAMINGAALYGGIHFHTESLKTDKLECGWGVTSCAVCSPMPVIDVNLHMTMNEIDKLIDNIYNCKIIISNENKDNDRCQQSCNVQTTRDQNVTSTLVFSCTYNLEDAKNVNSVTDNVQHRIFLSYREGHPLAKTICGSTLHDILVHEYHLESFVQEWQHRWMMHWHKHNEISTLNRRSNTNLDTNVNLSNAYVFNTNTDEVIIPVIERLAQEGMPTLHVALRLV